MSIALLAFEVGAYKCTAMGKAFWRNDGHAAMDF